MANGHLPLPPQGDLDDRAETVEPLVVDRPELPTVALFAHRAFMRLWSARMAGTSANEMLLVALGWQMYDLTHSALDLGLVGLFQFAPALHRRQRLLARHLERTHDADGHRHGEQHVAVDRVGGPAPDQGDRDRRCAALQAATIRSGSKRSTTWRPTRTRVTADRVNVVIRQSLVQLDAPNEMRGCVSAVNSVFLGASNPLGEFESGLTAAWLGPVDSVVVGGIGTLIVAGDWLRLFPALAHRDRRVATAS